MKMLIILSSIFSNHTIICAGKKKKTNQIIARNSNINESNARLCDIIVIFIYNHNTKSGSNQTAFMLKLGNEQLTSDVSMIKVMV